MADGISICITAYKAEKFIKETLDSIYIQTWFETHNDYEILVGIDACKDTLECMEKIQNNYPHLRVLMMKSNAGTYVTMNTLIKEAKYDNIIRFDSDDIMLPNMVEKLMKNDGNADTVRYYLQNFGCDTKKYSGDGSFFFRKNFVLRFGGFQPWKCSADTEIKIRLKNVGKHRTIGDVLFLRRCHNESLTRKPGETTIFGGRIGEYRRKVLEYTRRLNVRTEKDAKIKFVTNYFTEVFNSMNVDSTNYETNIMDVINKIQETVKSEKRVRFEDFPDLQYMTIRPNIDKKKKITLVKKRMITLKNNRVNKRVYYNY